MELITITPERITTILDKIRNVKIAVYGDFCLDAYWLMDPRGSEISVETGKKAEATKKHYYSPGGASNIAANLAALKPRKILAIGVIGDDIFGRELTAQLNLLGIDTSSFILQKDHFDTYTFIKRYRDEEEDPRIDFGRYNERLLKTDQILIDRIGRALEKYDALIFNQQVPDSITHPSFIEKANSLFRKFDDKIILVDSRHYPGRFSGVWRKTNETEIARLNGEETGPSEYTPLSRLSAYGESTYQKDKKPVFITCGEWGIIVCDHEGSCRVPGIRFLTKLDPVGAGDTTLSALALSMAAGFTAREAAAFANLAAAVTVQKIFTTGTAGGGEILELSKDPDYIYRPDLAENIDLASYQPGTGIEICDPGLSGHTFPVKYAVFDHDGTISNLRKGWEKIMERTMIEAICGTGKPDEEDPRIKKIRNRVKNYIDRSTGIQTYLQMKTLEDMVHEFRIVPERDRRQAKDYKKMYLGVLMQVVNDRLQGIKSGQLHRNDFIVAGAVDFLKALKEKGVLLFLASGTDRPDVIQEAGILDYANLFEGGIFGSRDDISKFSKKLIIREISEKYNVKENQLMVAGDGPVEIMEGSKYKSLLIGVASDDQSPGRLNRQKRERLIKAGAALIIPDFTEYDKLLNWIQ